MFKFFWTIEKIRTFKKRLSSMSCNSAKENIDTANSTDSYTKRHLFACNQRQNTNNYSKNTQNYNPVSPRIYSTQRSTPKDIDANTLRTISQKIG